MIVNEFHTAGGRHGGSVIKLAALVGCGVLPSLDRVGNTSPNGSIRA